jgi:hypothetical protein
VIEKADPPKVLNIHDLVKQIKKGHKTEPLDWGRPEGREVW